jgi:uncharacterized membrane protein YpjA
MKWDFLRQLPDKRHLFPLLIGANLLGAVYGFYWYRYQLAGTPWYYWPVVPDSPLAVLFFTLFLVNIYIHRRQYWVEAFGYLAMLKYGLWTPFVLAQAGVATGNFDFESFHLSLSHLAMAIEAWIFLRYYIPPSRYAIRLLLWFLANDYLDYFWGTHPTLPAPQYKTYAAVVAFGSTIISFLLVLYYANRQRLQLKK